MQTPFTFRVFVSSTFRDFDAERRVLHERVFPAVAAFCETQGARIFAVDMRFGVSIQAAERHRTMPLCLDEVDRCIARSPRPSFIAMLGQRSGWRPLPVTLEDSLVRRLRPGMDDEVLFDTAYRLDSNGKPAQWVLVLSDSEGSKAEATAAIEDALWALLRRAAAACGALAELSVHDDSATALEVRRFLQQAPKGDAIGLVYVRRIKGLADAPISVRTRYVDAEPERDMSLLPAASNDRSESADPSVDGSPWRSALKTGPNLRLRNVEARLDGDGLDSVYLAGFAEQVQADLVSLVERELQRLRQMAASRSAAPTFDGLARRAPIVLGREALLARLTSLSPSTPETSPAPMTPVVLLHGAPGVGKSTLLSTWLQGIDSPEAPDVLACLAGLAPDLTRREALLRAAATALRAAARNPRAIGPIFVRSSEPEGVDGDLPTAQSPAVALMQEMWQWPKDRPLVVVVDGLDALLGSPLASWLPSTTPPHVRLLVSVADGPELDSLRMRLPDAHALKVEGLGFAHMRQLIVDELDQADRSLLAAQADALAGVATAAGQPLYAVLAAAQVSRWRSFDSHPPLAPSLHGLIAEWIETLMTLPDHGPNLGRWTLGAMAASQHGLSDEELHAILASCPEVMAEHGSRFAFPGLPEGLPYLPLAILLQTLSPHLRKVYADGIVLHHFVHRVVAVSVLAQLFPDHRERAELHRRLAAYFAGQPNWTDVHAAQRGDSVAHGRKALEWWMQLHAAGDGPQLARALRDFDVLMARCATGRVQGLAAEYADLAAATGDAELGSWIAFMRNAEPLLARGGSGWQAHRILLQLAAEEPAETPVARAAAQWLAEGRCGWVWWRRAEPRLPADALSTHRTWIEGPTGGANRCVALRGGGFLMAGEAITSHDAVPRLWRVPQGDPTLLIGLQRRVDGMFETVAGHIVAWGGVQRWCLWRADGALLRTEVVRRKLLGAAPLRAAGFVVWVQDGRIRTYDEQGRLALDLEGPTQRPFQVIVLAGDELFAWADGFRTCRYAADGRPLALPADVGHASRAWLLRDGTALVAGTQRTWHLDASESRDIGPRCSFVSELDGGDVILCAESVEKAAFLWRAGQMPLPIGTLAEVPISAHRTPAGDLAIAMPFESSVGLDGGRRWVRLEGHFLAALGDGSLLMQTKKGLRLHRRADGRARPYAVTAGGQAFGSDEVGLHATPLRGGFTALWNSFRPHCLILDAQGRALIAVDGLRDSVKCVVDLDGQGCLVADGSGRVRVVEIEALSLSTIQPTEPSVRAGRVWAAGCAGFVSAADGERVVHTWGLDGRQRARLRISGWGHKSRAGTGLLPLVGGRVATWADDVVCVQDLTGRVLVRNMGYHREVYFALPLRDGRFVTADFKRPLLRLWSSDGMPLRALHLPGWEWAMDAIETVDGGIAALGRDLAFWDAQGRFLRSVPSLGFTRVVQLARDRFALGSFDPELVVIDATGRVLTRFRSVNRFQDERLERFRDVRTLHSEDAAISRARGPTEDGPQVAIRLRGLSVGSEWSSGLGSEPYQARWESLHGMWQSVAIASADRIACIAGSEVHVLARMDGGHETEPVIGEPAFVPPGSLNVADESRTTVHRCIPESHWLGWMLQQFWRAT